ncbi:hypothetical protein V2I01_36625 [Micromonospora sp. BRA006-A]|nr:hypothetical protein [Micromonospora sp. BRA006-A]
MLTHLGETELLAGRFAEAGTHIAAARDLGEQLGTGLVGELAGRCARRPPGPAGAGGCRRRRAAPRRRPRRRLEPPAAPPAHRPGGACVRGWAAAAAAYGALAADLDGSGIAEPLGQRFEPDWIEACVGAGDLDTAHAALDRLARRHSRLPRPWTTLGLARSRVLLAGATGTDPGAALDALTQARAAVPEAVLPLDRARCLLAAGRAYRQVRRRREARAVLDAAVVEFDALGASAFADGARAELAAGARTRRRRRSPRPRSGPPGPPRGADQPATADAPYISPKTVEANARLPQPSIASRAELGAAMGRRPATERSRRDERVHVRAEQFPGAPGASVGSSVCSAKPRRAGRAARRPPRVGGRFPVSSVTANSTARRMPSSASAARPGRPGRSGARRAAATPRPADALAVQRQQLFQDPPGDLAWLPLRSPPVIRSAARPVRAPWREHQQLGLGGEVVPQGAR